MERHYGGNQSRFATEIGLGRQKVRTALRSEGAKVDLEVIQAVAETGKAEYDWLRYGTENPTESDISKSDANRRAASNGEPLRPGYTDIETWSEREGVPNPDAADPLGSLVPEGVVFVLVYHNDRGEPIYGFDHTGKVHQLGPPISVTVRPPSSSSSAGPTS